MRAKRSAKLRDRIRSSTFAIYNRRNTGSSPWHIISEFVHIQVLQKWNSTKSIYFTLICAQPDNNLPTSNFTTQIQSFTSPHIYKWYDHIQVTRRLKLDLRIKFDSDEKTSTHPPNSSNKLLSTQNEQQDQIILSKTK